MPELTLRAVTVPETAEADDGADFRAVIDLRNTYNRLAHGSDDYALTPAQALPFWHDQADWQLEASVILEGDEIVGMCAVEFTLDPGATAGGVNIRVLPERAGEGIGSAILPGLEDRVRERGRTSAQAWTEHAETPGARHPAATGQGAVPLDHSARFLVRHGYALEQVYRNSRLDIAAALPLVAELTDAARRASSPAYRTVSWETPTPLEWIEDFAWMKSRMSTDAPSGDVDVAEEVWDADRVRRLDAKEIGAGQRKFVTAALHVETGRLAAFTELLVQPAQPQMAHQKDTLVLAEHRGHRLGMLLKGVALQDLHDRVSEVAHVETYNAEENRPMLDINEAMGFVPVLYAGEWQKRLSSAAASDSARSSGSNGS